jgi:hypothetical protein
MSYNINASRSWVDFILPTRCFPVLILFLSCCGEKNEKSRSNMGVYEKEFVVG